MTDSKYVGGETHLYLGKQYRLKIISDEELKTPMGFVKLKGQFLEVHTGKKEKERELVEGLYLDKAKERFNQLALPLFESFIKRNGISDVNYILSIRQMPTC